MCTDLTARAANIRNLRVPIYHRFNIKGKGTDPKPQGPFEIKAGGSTTIKFKNVFNDTRMFKIYVDREEFYVKTLYEPIKAKKVSTLSFCRAHVGISYRE